MKYISLIFLLISSSLIFCMEQEIKIDIQDTKTKVQKWITRLELAQTSNKNCCLSCCPQKKSVSLPAPMPHPSSQTSSDIENNINSAEQEILTIEETINNSLESFLPAGLTLNLFKILNNVNMAAHQQNSNAINNLSVQNQTYSARQLVANGVILVINTAAMVFGLYTLVHGS